MLVPPEIVPGRMTLLVTVFLVLVNIFNTITTNIPKAEGLTGKQKMKIILFPHYKYSQPVYSHWLCYVCHCNLAVIVTDNDSTNKVQ